MTALARASSNCKLQTHPRVKEGVINNYERKYSVEKIKLLVVSLKGLVAKTN
jgi:hypothetical protein